MLDQARSWPAWFVFNIFFKKIAHYELSFIQTSWKLPQRCTGWHTQIIPILIVSFSGKTLDPICFCGNLLASFYSVCWETTEKDWKWVQQRPALSLVLALTEAEVEQPPSATVLGRDGVVLRVMVWPLRLSVIESCSEAEMFKKICTWAKSIPLVYIMCLKRRGRKNQTKSLEWTRWGPDGPEAKEPDRLVLFLPVSYTNACGRKRENR